MSNDKMREALDCLEQLAQLADANGGLDNTDAADLCVAVQKLESALSQQPAPQDEEYEHLHNTIALLTKQLVKAEKSLQVPKGVKHAAKMLDCGNTNPRFIRILVMWIKSISATPPAGGE